MWSRKYINCQKCGTVEVPHISKGLCRKCYNSEKEKIHGNYVRNTRGIAEELLTKEMLEVLYIAKEMSLTDIGRFAGTTRTNVFAKMKRFSIPTRSIKESRDLALEKGKIQFKTTVDGNEHIRVLKKIKFNETIFETWSNEMAYVLGLIVTDGNVNYSKSATNTEYLQGGLTFCQKDIELVKKFSQLIGFDSEIEYRKERFDEKTAAGALYCIHINSNDLLVQLEKLGITPKKSMSVKFPDMPKEYLRHFIRGCWDGDGTVYIENNGRIRASFISGSKSFIENLMEYLEDFGLSNRKLYEHNHSRAYYFRYVSDDDCFKLFNLLYKDVSPEQFYSKKHQIFKGYFNNHIME